ncbi:MAG: imidazole glycerol phosphate synthase subunit HisH [Acidobacteriota bacterium]
MTTVTTSEDAARATDESRSVVVLDAGVGNLGNLVRALRHVGAEPELTTDPDTIAAGDCLVLPGVGAFRPPRETLRGPMEEALRSALDRGAWLLGICVGYQLLFEGSTEFGDTDGLGLLPGRVEALPGEVSLPQIGWNHLVDRREHPLLAGLPERPSFYFVHSYAPLAGDGSGDPDDSWLAQAVHGAPFVAVAGQARVFGTQFHPEKSGRNGLRLLANYLDMAHGRAHGAA